MRKSMRMLTIGPGNEPAQVRLYVEPIGERWAAMIMGDESLSPGPDELRGQGFFGDTAEEAEQPVKAFLGMSGSVH